MKGTDKLDYRELLYSTYVSRNKARIYETGSAESRERYSRSLLRFLRDWLPPQEDDPRALDLGCGCGNMLEVYQRAGYSSFVGVDNSAEQVDLARRRFPTVIQADVFDYLQRQDIGVFDVITAFDLLEHLDRNEVISFLRLVRPHLKHNGCLIMQMPNGDSPFVGSIFYSDLTHETLFTAVSLQHVLEACGFSDCGFKERAPVPMGVYSSVRWVLYQLLRLGIKAAHYIETGGPSTGIYTRLLACRARRGDEASPDSVDR